MSSGGKGGSTTTNSTQAGSTTTQIPAWLENASQGAVDYAQQIAQIPYQAYGGEIVAGTTPDQMQAYQQVRDMQGAADPAYQASQQAYQGLLGSAAPITSQQLSGDINALYGNYGQQVVAPTAGLLGNYLANASPATAQQVGANAMELMNPYTQSVINPSLKLSQQQLEQNLRKIGSQASNVGAFGGSRQGVEEGVATSQAILGTQSNIANLLAQGYNAAMTPAYGLASKASEQGYGAAGLLAGQLGQGYQNAQQQAGSLAAANQQAGLAAAQQLPNVATAQQAQRQKEAAMLESIGQSQQQQQQNVDTAAMQQFYEKQDYPYQQLDTLLAAVGGVPYSTSGTSYNTGTSETYKEPGLLDWVTGITGAVATGVSASDRRLKTDIQRVGKTDAGTPLYKYRFKGDPFGIGHIGVMAQELKKTQPEAVKGIGGGLLGVDYSKVE